MFTRAEIQTWTDSNLIVPSASQYNIYSPDRVLIGKCLALGRCLVNVGAFGAFVAGL